MSRAKNDAGEKDTEARKKKRKRHHFVLNYKRVVVEWDRKRKKENEQKEDDVNFQKHFYDLFSFFCCKDEKVEMRTTEKKERIYIYVWQEYISNAIKMVQWDEVQKVAQVLFFSLSLDANARAGKKKIRFVRALCLIGFVRCFTLETHFINLMFALPWNFNFCPITIATFMLPLLIAHGFARARHFHMHD